MYYYTILQRYAKSQSQKKTIKNYIYRKCKNNYDYEINYMKKFYHAKKIFFDKRPAVP